MDILIQAERENAKRVLNALHEFGFGSLDITADHLAIPEQVVQLGNPPVRIDLLTSLTGVSWDRVAAGRQAGQYDDVPVW